MAPPSRDRTHDPHTRFTRRSLLGAGALAVGGATTGALTGCPSPSVPAESAVPTTPSFVLVHGSASNSYFWTPLVRDLALLGRRSLPVDLPGHGTEATLPRSYQSPQDTPEFASSPSLVGKLALSDYVDRVHDTVRTAASHGPVVLVGHSLGGSVVTGVANAAPHLLHGISYVSAFCCTELESPLAYLGTEEATRGAAAPATNSLTPEQQQLVPSGVSRYNWRSADPAFVTSSHQQLMAEATEEQFLATIAVAQQPDESIRASLEAARIEPESWGHVRRGYVRLTEDRVNTPALQDRMIGEADRASPEHPFEIDEIDCSHLGVFTRSHDLAGLLHRRWP